VSLINFKINNYKTNLKCHRGDLIGVEQHLPDDAEEDGAVGVGEVLDDVVLVGHRRPGLILVLHRLLQLSFVFLRT
jgi:hypothetical protein